MRSTTKALLRAGRPPFSGLRLGTRRQQPLSSRVGIVVAVHHCLGERVEIRLSPQPGLCQRQDLRSGPRQPAGPAVGAVVIVDGGHQIRNAVAPGGHEAHDRRLGFGPQVPHGLFGTLPVGLVDGHDVGDIGDL